MKRIVTILLLFFILSLPAFANEVKIIVNGSVLPMDKGVRKGAFVLLPVKPVADKMKRTLVYDSKDRRVKLMKKGFTAIFYVGQQQINVNGNKMMTPFVSEIIDGKVCIPTAFFSDYFGCDVRIDHKKGIVFVNSVSEGAKNDLNQDGGIDDIKDFDF